MVRDRRVSNGSSKRLWMVKNSFVRSSGFSINATTPEANAGEKLVGTRRD